MKSKLEQECDNLFEQYEVKRLQANDLNENIENKELELRALRSGTKPENNKMHQIFIISDILLHVFLFVLHMDYLYNIRFNKTKIIICISLLVVFMSVIAIILFKLKTKNMRILVVIIVFTIVLIIIITRFAMNLHNLTISPADRKIITIKSIILPIIICLNSIISHPLYNRIPLYKCPMRTLIVFLLFFMFALIVIGTNKLISPSLMQAILKFILITTIIVFTVFLSLFFYCYKW